MTPRLYRGCTGCPVTPGWHIDMCQCLKLWWVPQEHVREDMCQIWKGLGSSGKCYATLFSMTDLVVISGLGKHIWTHRSLQTRQQQPDWLYVLLWNPWIHSETLCWCSGSRVPPAPSLSRFSVISKDTISHLTISMPRIVRHTYDHVWGHTNYWLPFSVAAIKFQQNTLPATSSFHIDSLAVFKFRLQRLIILLSTNFLIHYPVSPICFSHIEIWHIFKVWTTVFL